MFQHILYSALQNSLEHCYYKWSWSNVIFVSISFLQIYETKSDKMEMKDKILLCIEKQALVQIIIRELSEQLMKSNYVSAN